MKKSWNEVVNMLVLSIGFTIVLLTARILYTAQLYYYFYVWNLFLAIIPVIISRSLYLQEKLNAKAIIKLVCWLLFLPNAPYIITDIFHFQERTPVPKWVDLLLVTSAAWNGLILGIVSILQVESFLLKHYNKLKVDAIITATLLLSAFGIYLGRFLRFNSWDVIAKPGALAHALHYRIVYPFDNLRTWGFTLLFGCLLWMSYYTVKKLSGISVKT
jgi:uncharacterized membrane protein